jgi:hypothetical protein
MATAVILRNYDVNANMFPYSATDISGSDFHRLMLFCTAIFLCEWAVSWVISLILFFRFGVDIATDGGGAFGRRSFVILSFFLITHLISDVYLGLNKASEDLELP